MAWSLDILGGRKSARSVKRKRRLGVAERRPTVAVGFSPRIACERGLRRGATLETIANHSSLFVFVPVLTSAMANTYTSLHYHVIFSTKDREPGIRQDTEQRIWSYLGGIARENDIKALLIGGIEDHVHLLLDVPAVLALSKAVQ
ncbi:MAG: transposase IS200-family protein [Verrucomicrobiales bacterium]|nr:transposase IS200-family protein [Verrucomicrobiales bacterium]